MNDTERLLAKFAMFYLMLFALVTLLMGCTGCESAAAVACAHG